MNDCDLDFISVIKMAIVSGLVMIIYVLNDFARAYIVHDLLNDWRDFDEIY